MITVISCVDDKMGMAFFGRRQSRDRRVTEDILKSSSGKTLWVSERSAPLFAELNGDISVCESFMQVPEGGVCFVEFSSPGELKERCGTVILYRWNRRYPASLYFDIPLEGWHLAETTDFEGTSHDKITREVYVREEK